MKAADCARMLEMLKIHAVQNVGYFYLSTFPCFGDSEFYVWLAALYAQ